jgi:hypothetical protein
VATKENIALELQEWRCIKASLGEFQICFESRATNKRKIDFRFDGVFTMPSVIY